MQYIHTQTQTHTHMLIQVFSQINLRSACHVQLDSWERVADIVIVPHFIEQARQISAKEGKEYKLGMGEGEHRAIWIVDCYAVHRAKELLATLRRKYPWYQLGLVCS